MKGSNFRRDVRSIDRLWMSEYLNTYSDTISKLKKISLGLSNKNPEQIANQSEVKLSTLSKEERIDEILKPYKENKTNIDIYATGKKKRSIRIKSKRLETLFEIQRREHESAKKIQLFWKHYRVLLPWRHAVKCVLLVTQIQKYFRGYIARKYIGVWYRKQCFVSTQWQARARRILSNKTYFTFELPRLHSAAKRIQSIYRGHKSRMKILFHKQCNSILTIQRVWRGVVSRCRFDRIWLDKVVIPIQTIIRRVLAIKRFKLIRTEVCEAVVKIQRVFRQWQSRRIVGDRFITREAGYRQNTINCMAAAATWTEDELIIMAKRLNKGRLVNKVQSLVSAVYSKYDRVHDLQLDLIQLEQQAQTLSPRSIRKGWALDYKQQVVELRKMITSEKLECIFMNAYDVSRFNSTLEQKVKDIEEMVAMRNRMNRWREEEELALHDLVFERRGRAKEKARVVAIADEKRTWRLKQYTHSGKPDKTRRDGRVWKNAGPEKAVYSAATGVDLLAFTKDDSCTSANEINQNVDFAVSKFSLKVYLNQIAAYEKLLQPISSIMGSFLDGSKGQNMGYGHDGADLTDALVDIGAISAKKNRNFEAQMIDSSDLSLEPLSPAPLNSPLRILIDKRYKKLCRYPSTVSVLSDITSSVVDEDSNTFFEPLQRKNSRPPQAFSTPSFYSGAASSVPQSVYSRTISVSTTTSREISTNSSASNYSRLSRLSKNRKDSKKASTNSIPWEMLDKLDAERKNFDDSVLRTKSTFAFRKL